MIDPNLSIYEMHKQGKYPNAPFARTLYELMQNHHYKVSIYAPEETLKKIAKQYGPINDLHHIPKMYKPGMIYVQVDKVAHVQNVFSGLFHKDMIL